MKKLIMPTLMDTYTLIKSWDFDAKSIIDISFSKTKNWFYYPENECNKGKEYPLTRQMFRAVSSPSLTASALEQEVSSNSKIRGPINSSQFDSNTNSDTNLTNNTMSSINQMSSNQHVGVLQKFKRTLTNFNRQPSTQPSCQSSSLQSSHNLDSIHATTTAATNGPLIMSETDITSDSTDNASTRYRFGPLIWRSSKERRKTKHNRRDKCNSGDSGIQIELENDEQFSRVLVSNVNADVGKIQDSEMSSLKVRSVRRTSSAKVSSLIDQASPTNAGNKAKFLRRFDLHNEREAPESLPTRSLSQPSGLESCGMNRNDLEADSDSDSVTSHDDASNYYPVYAEVLYNFTAAGPQELGLEKGTLIEILRKEVGPWWFGLIKKEGVSLVEEILDPEMGWFPKEFVRVIQSPDTDAFYLEHITMQQLQHQHQRQHLQQNQQRDNERLTQQQPSNLSLSTSFTLTPSNTSLEDNTIGKAVIDHQHNNVTTIVIDSSTLTHTDTASNTATEIADCNSSRTNIDELDCSPIDTNISTTTQQTILYTSQSPNVVIGGIDILRRSAIKELLDTEVNYVKLLASICEGYLPTMSKRIDIFSPNSIRLIFSNITTIYKFQRKFLEALRKGIEQNQVAKVFLKLHKGFLCYSSYCNEYPRALIELESYERVKDARTILDNCRESENLAELPLSAHLLAPVQRICRYPLHLAEILKTACKVSEVSNYQLAENEQLVDVSQLYIPDTRETLDMALEAMKSITEAVNEGKRHSETIARHQASFQNFKGPPLHLYSTRFFLQIDATRQKQNLWNSSSTLFLFDNQLIYCKRDILKRSQFIYKGRIFLDRCRVINVRDGKMFGHTIKNSLRIYCEARDKWFDFSFRSANRKHRFLSTLALERQFGGKPLYVSEMAGFEYAFEERDYSDQSDYETTEHEQQGLGSSVSSHSIGGAGHRMKEFLYESNNPANSLSGDSSVPESPAKSFKYSDTLPKKSNSNMTNNTNSNNNNVNSNNSSRNDNKLSSESNTGSLGRRRLGNWFRKPKSSASTPNHSPTHKPTVSAHSTGDLLLGGSELTETYTLSESSGLSS
uniref:DH domain-containing protein n=1 Tax=Glossina pallidipes TaxID=7398 RepID=A0A1A9Z680_GLOPL